MATVPPTFVCVHAYGSTSAGRPLANSSDSAKSGGRAAAAGSCGSRWPSTSRSAKNACAAKAPITGSSLISAQLTAGPGARMASSNISLS